MRRWFETGAVAGLFAMAAASFAALFPDPPAFGPAGAGILAGTAMLATVGAAFRAEPRRRRGMLAAAVILPCGAVTSRRRDAGSRRLRLVRSGVPLAKLLGTAALLLGISATRPAAAEPAPPQGEIAALDLSKPIGTRSDWQITATQEPPIPDPFGPENGTVPGAVTVCLHEAGGPCDAQLRSRLFDTSDVPAFSKRHYLDRLAVVRSHGASGLPLLLLVTASLHSGDGDQLVLTQVMAYRRGPDRFVKAYEHWTGTNNNQEVRFMAAGPLAGDIIAVEPAGTAPFGYWITVNVLTSTRGYRPVLRFRSATTYGDGNALPVIDSDMANILGRLGSWRPGLPLLLPATPCTRPHLRRMELWCD